MNFYTILQLVETHGLMANKLRINVTKEACTLIGTTAELKPNIEVSLEDLYYGMMLPSGNDAAYQVAQLGGTIMKMAKDGPIDKGVVYNVEQLSYWMGKTTNSVLLFLN